jgi:ankyrin repeat protein
LSKTQINSVIKNKLDINWKNPKGNTFLTQSLKQESVNYNIVNALLQNGADPNIPDDLGKSPLTIAVHSGIPSIVDLLLKHDANPNYESKSLGLPLIDVLRIRSASNYNIIEIVELLLKSGADINLTTKNRESFISIIDKMENNELKEKIQKLIAINTTVKSLDSLVTLGRNPLTSDTDNLHNLREFIGGKRRRKTNKKKKRKMTCKRRRNKII